VVKLFEPDRLALTVHFQRWQNSIEVARIHRVLERHCNKAAARLAAFLRNWRENRPPIDCYLNVEFRFRPIESLNKSLFLKPNNVGSKFRLLKSVDHSEVAAADYVPCSAGPATFSSEKPEQLIAINRYISSAVGMRKMLYILR
jgi:hypothetical protein